MTDKQIINVSDCIYHNNGKCTNSAIGQCNCANVVCCYYKEYKRKEQECEELKKFQKLLEEQMKFNKSELELSLSSEIKRSEILLKEFKKVDKQRDTWREKAEKYFKTLTEIKEIAEENIRIADLEGLNGVYRRGLAKQILQKISEVIPNEN